MIQFEFLFWNVGDSVTLTKDIWADADDYSPAGYYGRKGDIVIIKYIDSYEDMRRYPTLRQHPYSVAHEWVKDGSCFRVSPTEI